MAFSLSRAVAKFRRRLWRDRRGNFATEFALILPVALVMLVGVYSYGEAYSISRKVTITSHTIADLVARRISVSTSDVTTILNASAQIAAPYSTANMSIIVAELYTNNGGKTKVEWSRALNTTALSKGDNFTLPSGMAQNDTYLIYAIVTYTYSPPFKAYVPATLPITSTFYINPRVSASVPLT